MALDLKGAKKIGCNWAIWSYDKNDWASVSVERPDSSQAPADAVFAIDVAIQMNDKGAKPQKKGAAAQQPASSAPAPEIPQQYAPQLPPQSPMMPSGYPAPVIQQASKSSFFALPTPEKLAEQQKAAQAAIARPQPVAQQQQQRREEGPALPEIKPTLADMIMPILAGGLAMGVILGVPILNLCVPAWGIGGFLAVFLLLLASPIKSTLSVKDAAKLGFLTGLVAIGISFIVTFCVYVFAGQGLMVMAGVQNSETQMLAMNVMGIDNDFDIIFAGLTLFIRLLLFPIFGLIGAVAYVKFGRKK